jgi:hypothetical protein
MPLFSSCRDKDDVFGCCMDSCSSQIDTCISSCSSSRCVKRCKDIAKSCRTTCALSVDSWGRNKPISKCFSRFGCGEYPNFDRECVEKNAHLVEDCCRRECPTFSHDCVPSCIDELSRFLSEPLIFRKKEFEVESFPWFFLFVISVLVVSFFVAFLKN